MRPQATSGPAGCGRTWRPLQRLLKPSTTTTVAARASSSSSKGTANADAEQPRPSPPPPLAGALLAGATAGPVLDGIHSSVGLQVYDLLPLDLGPLHTSALVPPLLAAFYATLVALDGAAAEALASANGNDDAAANDDAGDSVSTRAPLTIAACYASLAAGLSLSAFLHSQQLPPKQIAAALAAFSALNFCAFDRTRRGLALALLCAVVAPLAEAQLMARFGAWHYPRADIQVPVLLSGLFAGDGAEAGSPASLPSSVGFVSWVPFCYFFYAPSVLLLGRRLRAAEKRRGRSQQKQGLKRGKNESL